jgi:hypothetical protein
MSALDVDIVDWGKLEIMLTDGQRVPIVNAFSEPDVDLLEGRQPGDPPVHTAAVIVAGPDANGMWWTVDVTSFVPVIVH